MTHRISVILPVYNAGPYLHQAIESILNQSYADFELLIINDASTDESASVVRSYHDDRIRLIDRKENRGLIATLNEGIQNSTGTYIARMDQDDISHPERFQKQVDFLDRNPDYGLVGTTYAYINEHDVIFGTFPALLENADLQIELLTQSSFGHGTIMMRRSILEKFSLAYNPAATHIEDYDLWTRFAKVSKVANLADILYFWRRHSESISSKNRPLQIESAKRLRNTVFDLAVVRTYFTSGTLSRLRRYANETVTINGKSVHIRRRNAFCLLHLGMAFMLFGRRSFLLGLWVLCCGFLIHPWFALRTSAHFASAHDQEDAI